MVWNATKPSNTEKIRNLGVVIRPNWKAIEQASDSDADADKLKLWAINLYDRNNGAVTGADTPARIDDAGQVYCRTDDHATDAYNELFFEDSRDSANEVQLTRDDRIGIIGQGVNASNLQFDEPIAPVTVQASYGINQMIIAQGRFDITGLLLSGVNMSSSAVLATRNPGNGKYLFEVDADILLNTNYLVIGTAGDDGNTNQRSLQVRAKGTPVAGTKTTIEIRLRFGVSAGIPGPFDIIIVGGR